MVSSQILAYADNINVCKADVGGAFFALKTEAAAMGLHMNIPKTKYIPMGKTTLSICQKSFGVE